MRLVNSRLVWASAALLVALVVLSCSAAPSADQHLGDQKQVAARPFKLPKLFDFESYKRLFNKSYSGLVENMTRAKLFMSRALRAFVSATKYRYRQARFYLAVNHLSDQSQAELDLMRNRKLEQTYGGDGRSAQATTGGADAEEEVATRGELPEFVPADEENVLETLRRVVNEHQGEPGFEELRAQLQQVEEARGEQSSRRKREAPSADAEALAPRELPLEKLINPPAPAQGQAAFGATPKSNNPLYEPPELESQGLVDQQTPLKAILIRPRANVRPLYDDISRSLESLRRKYLMNEYDSASFASRTPKPDEVFLDLREKSNCFLAPRNQGNCGSCYAFAATTVAEWLHCKTTGQLVAFSEQYVVDCGKQFVDYDMEGCNGGVIMKMAEFFNNFGWELLKHYPYVKRENTCPYPEETDLRTVGYIRADLRRSVQIDMALWPEALEKTGPLAININTGRTFSEYGAGVYTDCDPEKPEHSVVLIGHGREDGEEYWLIRNSYSVGWGEGGHIKLSKKADCIYPRAGFTFGSEDGENIVMRPVVNRANDGSKVKKQYLRRM